MERGPMPKLLLLFLLAEVQIFRLFMPIGFSIVCKEDIRLGRILLMGKRVLCLISIRDLLFFGRNIWPLLPFLTILKEKQINCYIQYTLNDYEKEGLEKGVPSVEKRIDTFKRLVDELSFGHVVWRFDPLMLTGQIDIPSLMEKVASIGDRLKGYTEKLVFSFADISSYRKVKMNLDRNHILYRQIFTQKNQLVFSRWKFL